MMKRYKWDFICILIIFIVSVVVTTRNFKAGYSLIGGDAGAVQEYPISAFKEALCVWFDRDNTGSQFGVNPSSLFPYFALLGCLRYLGFSAIFCQKVFFFSMFFISGISIYYLVRTLVRDSNLAALAGAFFYMFNHYTMVTWSSAVSNYSLTYMFMPVFVALYIKGLESGSNRCLVLLGLTSIAGLGGNLSLVAVVVFALGLYLVFYMVIEKRVFNPLWFSFKVLLLSVIFNLWWWLPTVISIEGLREVVQARGGLGWLDWMNWRTSFLNLFRLDGYTGWLNSFPYGLNFNNKFVLVAIGYFIPILVFASILWIKKYKNLGYFLFLVLVSLFLAKGKYEPAGGVFLWFFKYIPGFNIFRSSYDKFMPLVALAYSCLISIAVYEINLLWQRFSPWLGRMWVGAILIVVVIYPYPFWKGNLIRTKPDEDRSFFVKVPSEYDKAAEWLNREKRDFRILAIPQKRGDYIEYIWGYFGSSIDRYLYNKPIIDSYFKDIINILFEKTRDIKAILKFYTVKYLLFHFDNIDYRTAYYLRDFISKNLQLEKDYGKLAFYSINDKYFLPKIYIADNSIMIEGEEKELPYLANHGFLSRKPVLFLGKGKDNPSLPVKFFKELILCNRQGLPDAICPIARVSNILWDKWDKFIKGKFYIAKDSVYNIRLDISGEFISYYRKKDILFGKDMGDGDEWKCWSIGIKKAKYFFNKIGRLLFIDLYFKEDGKKDEYIQLKRRPVDIDLEKSPYFVMTYMIMNPRAQTLQAVLGLDFNNDGKVDGYLKNIYQIWAPTFLKEDIYNALKNAKNQYPGKHSYKVIFIELYPHKKWGINCSGDWEGRYGFYIANIKFCNFTQEEEFFEEREYAIDIDYSLPENSILKSSGIADGRYYVEFSQDAGVINLKRFSDIDFSCAGHWDSIDRVEVIMDLDFNGDDRKDAEEITLALYSVPNARRQEFGFDFKKIIKYKYRDKKYVNLLRVRWRVYCRKGYIERGLFLFKIYFLKVFSKDLIDPVGREFTLPIFKLDNKNYLMRRRFLKRRDFDDVEFKVGKVKLNKGWHSISSLLTKDNNFRINSISIREADFNKSEPPSAMVAEYEKINPTRYKVVIDAVKPFWLVFGETFDKGWGAYLYKSEIRNPKSGIRHWSALWQMWRDRGSRIDLKNHYKVNGYANGWYIDKIQNRNLEIVIEYIPQRFFELGVLVSGIGLIGVIIYLWVRQEKPGIYSWLKSNLSKAESAR